MECIVMHIIQLIFDIGILILLWKIYYKKSEIEIPEDHPEIDVDEFMNSLDFNMLLDDKIQPLLGKYKNEEIVDRVIKSFDKKDPMISQIDTNALRSYISDVLLNYSNNYKEEEYEFESYDNDEIVEFYKYAKTHKTTNPVIDPESIISTKIVEHDNNTVNLSNTLNNFYKD